MKNKRDAKHMRPIGERKFLRDFNTPVAKDIAKNFPMSGDVLRKLKLREEPDPNEFWSDPCWQEKPGKLG